MRRGRRVPDRERTGKNAERIVLWINRQSAECALSRGGVAVEAWKIGETAAGVEPCKRVNRGEPITELLPARALPPFGFFADQMTATREPMLERVRRDERGVQMIWPRNH